MMVLPLLAFWCSAFFVIVLCYIFAGFARSLEPSLDFGVGVVSSWAVLLGSAYIIDYFELPHVSLVFLVLSLFVLFYREICKSSGQRALRLFFSNTLNKETLILFCWWMLSVIFMSLPLIITFPPDTLIGGHFVCNDAVAHSLSMYGFSHTRALNLVNAIGFETYPRAFHSLMSIPIQLLNVAPIKLILLATMFSYSFLVFPLSYILKQSKGTVFEKTLCLLSAFSPFLLTTSIYLNFVAQIACIPLAIAALVMIEDIRHIPDSKITAICFFITATGATLTYGVFFPPLLVIYIPTVIKALRLIRLTSYRLLSVGIGLILCVSLCLVFYNNSLLLYEHTFVPTSENLVRASGNLPGFLSLLHLTGMWPGIFEYRAYPGPARWGLILGLVLIVQVGLVARKWSQRPPFLLLKPTISVLFVVSVVCGPYVVFKYLNFLLIIFSLCVSSSLLLNCQDCSKIGKIARTVLVGVMFYFQGISTLPAHFPASVFRSSAWQQISYINDRYITKGNTLILSKEDWFHSFIVDPGDNIEISIYAARYRNESRLDYFIVDTHARLEVDEYLLKRQRLAKRIKKVDPVCQKQLFNRYDVFDFRCNRTKRFN